MIITFPIRKLLYLFKKYILRLILKPFKILTINAKNVFKTKKIKNLFVGGDGAGITRGLAQAGANGVKIARTIIQREK